MSKPSSFLTLSTSSRSTPEYPSRSMPKAAYAGSPGVAWPSKKAKVAIPNMVGIKVISLRNKTFKNIRFLK